MLVSVEKNFVFVHVAKTGGQALKNTLRPYAVGKARGQWRRLLSHLPVREGFDAQFGPHTSARWAKLKLPRDFFDRAFKFALVRNPYDLAVSLYSFIGIKPDHHRHLEVRKLSFLEFLELEERRGAWRRRDQLSMLTGFGGEMLVDKVYRFEEMGEAFANIMRRLDLPASTELAPKNASPRGPYRDYYTGNERAFVERIWRRDLERFGYEF
jgi:hypothetical protein